VITFLYFRRRAAHGAQLALAHSYKQRIRAAGDPITGVTGTIPAREAEFDQINHALPFVEGRNGRPDCAGAADRLPRSRRAARARSPPPASRS
jgi:hypothetical protein